MVITQPIEVANIGIADSVILMMLALVVFGPRRLPEIGRKIGKLMYEFRKASNDFKFQMEEELRNSEEAEKRKALEAQQAEDHKKLMELVDAARKEDEKTASGEAPATPALAAESAVTTPSEASGELYVSPEDMHLHVRPPSTGEPVQAARPGSVADAANAIADMDAPENSLENSVKTEAATEGSAASEQTSHHG
jgi:sec-independent protein translocase protein TatB